jgi:glycosyltransferase involved in cell wall biosynthesis
VRIALLHYHLIRGGVTSVIREQARSLAEAGEEVLVIAGETGHEGDADPREALEFGGVPLAIVPGLRYDGRRGEAETEGAASDGSDRLAADIAAAMERTWGSTADVLHVHNPLIRRNRHLLDALKILKDRGIRMLLQNHDFAEDFRPDVYIEGGHYVDDVHYAAVNGRDYSLLRRSGLDADGTHLLANAVVPIAATPGLERTRYLYPVRGGRRKNLGEALLLSLFIPPGRTVAVMLPPLSAQGEATYRHWRDLAKRLRLPVEFDVGERVSPSDLYGSSVCAVTTSIKEGFGFSFLEPWTAGVPVIGRRLPYLCQDFERAGVRFDGLYESVSIPLVYLPAPLLRRKLESALSSAYRAFGLEAPPYILKTLTDDLFSRDVFDFGRLDEELQTDILEMLASNDASRADIADANPFLAALSDWEGDPDLIARNRDLILAAYSPAVAVARLRETYRSVIDHPVRQRLSKAILLELFLDPLKLSLIGIGHD